jgi:hypothetical protein
VPTHGVLLAGEHCAESQGPGLRGGSSGTGSGTKAPAGGSGLDSHEEVSGHAGACSWYMTQLIRLELPCSNPNPKPYTLIISITVASALAQGPHLNRGLGTSKYSHPTQPPPNLALAPHWLQVRTRFEASIRASAPQSVR